MDLQVIYEDNHIIVVNKTCHDLVQGDETGDVSLDKRIKDYLKEKYHKPGDVFLGVVHRLDRPVSGLVMFARTSKALTRLAGMFREGSIKKTYWAIVKNRPPHESGRLQHHLVRNVKQNKSFSHDHPQRNSKSASLSYQILGFSDRYCLLEIDLETGRHHQIRSQLSRIGSPIKGDLKYGFPRSNPDGGISLHARKLHFIHPVSKMPVNIEADPPRSEKLWESFRPV